MEQITIKKTLANGLSVILRENHSAPIISHWVWFRVGSRNECSGQTGISHWVEHMQFKGTHKFPDGVLERIISRTGGMWNAFTDSDWTAFFAIMPADSIDIVLELEADRMLNSVFTAEQVESERTVVIAEREGLENEPLFQLDEALTLKMFSGSAYAHEVIGHKADLLKITQDDLIAHYRRYYCPQNAVLVMVGDFDAESMFAKVSAQYEETGVKALPLQNESVAVCRELAQSEHVEMSGYGDTTYLKIAWLAPCGAASEFPVFVLLDSILSGPKNLNMFGGGGISNKTSCLHKALIESQIAVAVYGDYSTTIDPSAYTLTIIMSDDHLPDEAVSAVEMELQKIAERKLCQQDLDKALKQAKALFAYASEDITNQAFWLGYGEMFADYTWFDQFICILEKVTLDDICEMAQKLLSSARTIGIYCGKEDDDE